MKKLTITPATPQAWFSHDNFDVAVESQNAGTHTFHLTPGSWQFVEAQKEGKWQIQVVRTR